MEKCFTQAKNVLFLISQVFAQNNILFVYFSQKVS